MSTTFESTTNSPLEEDLKIAVASLKKEHPAIGIAKLRALLLSENPSWTVSEKRLRRILNNSTSDGDSLTGHLGLQSPIPPTGPVPPPSHPPTAPPPHYAPL